MIDLAADEYRLSLAPALGGAVTRFTWRGRDVLRPSPPNVSDILQTASFPLAPYANRIAHGRFTFGGRAVQLALNFGDHPHALHGHAWQRPWRVAKSSTDRATLEFAYEPGDWPWAYSVKQDVVLGRDGLKLTLSICNGDGAPMPSSFGFHPYFPRAPETVLQADVHGMWRIDDTIMPTEYTTELPIDLRNGAVLEGAPFIDNCFPGWSRTAHIKHLAYGVRMTAARELPFFHVYLPAGESYLCAEPVSAMPDAVNRQGVRENGLFVLQPGETRSVWMRIEASDAWSVRADRA